MHTKKIEIFCGKNVFELSELYCNIFQGEIKYYEYLKNVEFTSLNDITNKPIIPTLIILKSGFFNQKIWNINYGEQLPNEAFQILNDGLTKLEITSKYDGIISLNYHDNLELMKN